MLAVCDDDTVDVRTARDLITVPDDRIVEMRTFADNDVVPQDRTLDECIGIDARAVTDHGRSDDTHAVADRHTRTDVNVLVDLHARADRRAGWNPTATPENAQTPRKHVVGSAAVFFGRPDIAPVRAGHRHPVKRRAFF